MKLIATILLSCIPFLGCQFTGSEVSPEPTSRLVGSAWRLDAVEGTLATPTPDSRYEIIFGSPPDQASGFIRCNGWSGPYHEFDDGRLSVTIELMTDAECLGDTTFDDEYRGVLSAATHYELRDFTLLIWTDREPGTVLHFSRIEVDN